MNHVRSGLTFIAGAALIVAASILAEDKPKPAAADVDPVCKNADDAFALALQHADEARDEAASARNMRDWPSIE